MTALAEPEAATRPARPWLLGAFALLVLVVPIVCHGCHDGDHDDELSVPVFDEKISHR